MQQDGGPAGPGEAYVSGALTTLDDGVRGRLFYELLGEIVAAAGLRAYLPHRATDPVAAAHLDARTVYEVDRAHVSLAQLVVAYGGVPSFGVGIEVEIARAHSVPVILVVERDRPVSRILLGDPAVVEVVRFADLDGLRRSLRDAVVRVRSAPRPDGRPQASDHVVVQRFLASLEHARRLPEAEIAALLRVAELDGPGASAIRGAVSGGRLFGAGLRELVGKHALRGADLALFVIRDVLERPLAEACRAAGLDERSGRRRLADARARLGLAADADRAVVGQWLVTELIAPPTRALQLQLFSRGIPDGQRPEEAEDQGQAGVAFEEGQPRA